MQPPFGLGARSLDISTPSEYNQHNNTALNGIQKGKGMVYWRLFYHITWATKTREPLVTAEIEAEIHQLIRSNAVSQGARVHAVNGMPDHIHLIASIPPSIDLSTFVGRVKGATSAIHNKEHPEQRIEWQRSYAIFSLDAKRLPHHVAYVENQKDHHRDATTFAVLERDGSEK